MRLEIVIAIECLNKTTKNPQFNQNFEQSQKRRGIEVELLVSSEHCRSSQLGPLRRQK